MDESIPRRGEPRGIPSRETLRTIDPKSEEGLRIAAELDEQTRRRRTPVEVVAPWETKEKDMGTFSYDNVLEELTYKWRPLGEVAAVFGGECARLNSPLGALRRRGLVERRQGPNGVEYRLTQETQSAAQVTHFEPALDGDPEEDLAAQARKKASAAAALAAERQRLAEVREEALGVCLPPGREVSQIIHGSLGVRWSRGVVALEIDEYSELLDAAGVRLLIETLQEAAGGMA